MNRNDTIDKLFLIVFFILLFVFTLTMFNSGGAFGSESLYGVGLLLASIETLILMYITINMALFNSMSSFLKLIFIWMLWVLTTCFDYLFPLDIINFLLSGMTVECWCLVFLFFYIYTKKNINSVNYISNMFYIIMLCSSFLFVLVFKNKNITIDDNFASLNMIYYPLLLMPWVLLAKNKFICYLGLLIIGVLVILSMKRTAMIEMTLALIIFFSIETLCMQSKKSINILRTSLLIVAIVGVFYLILVKTDFYLITRFASSVEDKGSNRLDIYKDIIDLLSNSTMGGLILGHGHNSAISYTKMKVSAHNDWLEVIFDYGFIGVAIYTFVHIFLIKKTYILIKNKSSYAASFAVSYMFLFVMSLSSHLIIYPTYFIFLASYWGAVFAATAKSKTYGITYANTYASNFSLNQ